MDSFAADMLNVNFRVQLVSYSSDDEDLFFDNDIRDEDLNI